MILVTGAGGKTGRAIIKALIEGGQKVRAFIRSKEHQNELRRMGVNEFVSGDMLDSDSFVEAVVGARKIYHICPNVSPHEVEMSKIAIIAAKQTGIEHFVYHSVLHPQIEAMPHHWNKMRVEEMIFAAGFPYTILQPTAYMQNITTRWNEFKETGIFSVPYSLETRVSLVDMHDVASAAVETLTQPGHNGATYELCSAENPDQHEIAELLSQSLGQPIQANQISIDEWRKNAANAGLGEYQIDALSKMFAYYEGQNLLGSSKVLELLLGRDPTSLSSFLSSFD